MEKPEEVICEGYDSSECDRCVHGLVHSRGADCAGECSKRIPGKKPLCKPIKEEKRG